MSVPIETIDVASVPVASALEIAAWLGLSVLGLGLSAFFSGVETGVYTINRVRLAVRAGRREPAALRLRDELEHPDRLLSTLLVGNNIANYLGTLGVAAILAAFQFDPGTSVAINALILIPVLFVLAETLPKDLFRTHTDRWTYAASGALVATRVLFSIIGLVPFVTWFGQSMARLVGASTDREIGARQRVSQLIREGVGAGVLTPEQVTLADRALELRDRRVADELIAWRRVATVPLSADRASRESIMRSRPYSRLPVVDRRGRVVGVLHAIDVALQPDVQTPQLMRPIVEVDPETPSLEALQRMREARARLAIVRTPDSDRPLGIVALKDLVEPLVGDLQVW